MNLKDGLLAPIPYVFLGQVDSGLMLTDSVVPDDLRFLIQRSGDYFGKPKVGNRQEERGKHNRQCIQPRADAGCSKCNELPVALEYTQGDEGSQQRRHGYALSDDEGAFIKEV